MGTTTTGLPYPEPTDPVADGAAAIRALAEAIGSTWTRQPGIVLNAGAVATGDIIMPAVGVVDSLVVNLGAAVQPITIQATLTTFYGYASGFVNGHTDMYRYRDGGLSGTQLVQAPAGAWVGVTVADTWSVNAGEDASFKGRYFLDQAGGNAGYYSARFNWIVFSR